MRHLARWLLNAMTVLSLLMCVATAALWVHGSDLSRRSLKMRHSPKRPEML
jgi:hypothetical protein